jgi:hypothetical protein
MVLRGSAVLVSSLLVLAGTAGAVVPRSSSKTTRSAPRPAADTLTALPAAGVDKPLRTSADVRWSHPATPAWQKLAATAAWQASWDRATGVPSRIWGAGIPAPGAVASAEVAARFARAALADHLALLAPGASVDDFVLVSNHHDGNLRAVGFVQKHGGRRVVGGQISFRFKNDRLFVIGSEALPNIQLPARPRTRLSRAALRDRAGSALRRDLALPDAPVSAPGDEVVLPLIGDDAVLGYRIAVPVTIDGGAAGRYLAYSDPASGALLAVRQMNLFTVGTLKYRAVDRYPARPRIDRPAPRAQVRLNGAPQTTSDAGELTWTGADAQTVSTAVVGDLVEVRNKADDGVLASTELALTEAGVVWDASGAEVVDAQVQTYLNVNAAKAFARVLDPAMPTLDEPMIANVNLDQDCNAFYDGTTINFFRASVECQNTSLVEDVVYHEYGHALHDHEIIEGVGAFDGALSEGAADFFAAQITGDPGMGRGFFFSDSALRDLDPPDREHRWPQDVGEIHKTGIIFGGTFWDLRKALIAELGAEQGALVTQQLFVGALRRSVNIPTSLIEVLATDDDDGDLANGTPHECAIRNAYALHGLRTATGVVLAPDHLGQPTLATTVRIELSGLTDRCSSDEIERTELIWKSSRVGGIAPGKATAVQSAPSRYYVELPLAVDDKVLYQVQVVFKDQATLVLPDNLADPFYELYVGRTIPLYCVNFEDGDPMGTGWQTGTPDGMPSPWTWGTPSGGSTKPPAAFSGAHALVMAADGNYTPQSSSFIKMPSLDIGPWTDVHLQYRRWLAVEDSEFDQARVTVGGKTAWVNFTQNVGDSSSTHHIDREWRFQDIVVSGYQTGRMLDIGWDLTSDQGLEFSGWAIDDVCVVANVNGVCGDGRITVHETCDDGEANGDRPDACRSWCQKPSCGDRIIDSAEACDDGPEGGTNCSTSCELITAPELGGCCSTARGAGGSCALSVLVLGWLLRRRRRALP